MRYPEKTLRERFSGVSMPSPIAVAAVLVGCLFLLRIPTALMPRELDVDESMLLAQGMKFLVDPVPWRGADGTSSGPLNSYPISLLLLVGFRATYVLIHLLATAIVGLHALIAHRTM